MRFNFRFFSNPDQNLQFIKRLILVFSLAMRYLSFGAFGLMIYQLGYTTDPEKLFFTTKIFEVMVFLLGLAIILGNILSNLSVKNKRVIFEFVVAIFLLVSVLIRWDVFTGYSPDVFLFSEKYILTNI